MSAALVFALSISIVILVVGTLSGRNSTTRLDDYYLANRGVGRWLGAIAASAASESAWVMMGLVGAAYTKGVSVYWLVPGCIGGYAFNWFVLARKLQAASRKTGAITIAQLVGAETGSGTLRLVCAVVTIAFLTAYASAQFFAIGKALNDFAGLNVTVGTLLGAAFVLTYITVGGMRASILTDTLQGFLMVAVLVVMPLFVVTHLWLGGAALSPGLPTGYFSFGNDKAGMALVGMALGWAGIGLGYPGQPHVLQRHLTMKDPNEVFGAGCIAIGWSTAVFVGAISTGIAARFLVAPPDPELSLLVVAYTITGPVLAGLAMAAIFAAIASTADSQLIAISASIKNDIPLFREWHWFNPRLATIVISVAAATFASLQSATIFGMVLYAWEFLSVTIGIAVIGTFVMPRRPSGILGSMGVGVVTLLVWRNVGYLNDALYSLVPAMALALGTLWLSGLLGVRRERAVT